jgi:perosamine synthetase
VNLKAGLIKDDFIAIHEPVLAGNEWKYVKECLESGWVSSAGTFVRRFEHELATYVKSPYAISTINGTAALHLALKVLGVSEGDEVIVPDLTFVAPVNAVRYCQAHPVLIDADPRSWQIDVLKLEQFLSEECEIRGERCYNRGTGRLVRAVLPVHVMGLACRMDEILSLAHRFRLLLVEDASEALGVRYRGRHVGTFGDAGVFSFNANKIVTSGGGGMIVTSNGQVAQRAYYLSTQAKDGELEYIHNEVGYNYRLTNMQAALGLAQLEQIDAFITRKRVIAKSYEKLLGSLDGITLMPTPDGCEPTWWLYTVLLSEGISLEERKRVIERLQGMGIGARPFWHPIHSLPPYRGCQAFRIEHSNRLYERGVSLPSGVGLSDSQIEQTAAAFKKCVS